MYSLEIGILLRGGCGFKKQVYSVGVKYTQGVDVLLT